MRERRARHLGRVVVWIGAMVVLTAGLWWWLVFRQIVESSIMSVSRALPCMVGESVVCRLAQALCSSDHFLGIRRYDAELFWAGCALLVAGVAIWRLSRERAAQPERI